MKLPWKNKQDSTLPQEVPQEVQEYYQASRRERVGVAWVLAAATLVVTILLAIGLFFGGRWVYRQVFGNNDPAETTETQDENETNQSPAAEDNDDQPGATVIPGQADDDAAVRPQGNGGATQTPNPAPNTTPTTTPQTGPSPEIPRTGPDISD